MLASPGHLPSLDEERALWQRGYRLVAGIDEVGRGPLAGPVVAAAVIFPPDIEAPWLALVRDSKQLNERARLALRTLIGGAALSVGYGIVLPETIDAQGIVRATRMAMAAAVANLVLTPHYLLTDAVALPDIALPQSNIIKGDTLSTSIACASIVAKVMRDRIMVEMDELFPGYGFARHKGYATAEHLERLRCLGACPIHRRCFAPVRQLTE